MKIAASKKRALRALTAAAVILLTVSLGLAVQSGYAGSRREEASHLLELYKENLTLIMTEQLNYANGLANIDTDVLEQSDWSEWKAREFLSRDAVLSVMVFKGDTLQTALPETVAENVSGTDLRDFSYLYTLAKVVKEPVVEGPIALPGIDENVFLFLQPLLDGRDYKGEIAIAIDEEYVIETLDLKRLCDLGYDYHLWKVNSQDGSKDIVASSNTELDFSYAAKTEFYLPSLWTLSIMPKEGWISREGQLLIMGSSVLLGVLLAALILKAWVLSEQNRYYKRLDLVDRETGMPNREGFCRALDLWIQKDQGSVCLFYFSVEEFGRVSLMAGSEREKEYLRGIPLLEEEYIKSPYLSGRISQGSFAIAVREDMTELEKLDFAKGLALKMMWKVRFHGEKLFLNTRYHYVSYPADGNSAKVLLRKLTDEYYCKLSKESPIYDMTEKCRQLAEGRSDVEFSKYTDLQMMELSKALNQYKKSVEQVAYYDPVYNIGNRMKYLRDVDMFISYDPKRRFRLYGIDIRSFSKYNELFSVTTGDALLLEMTRRFKEIFGSNLYRINGDVFMGISFEQTYRNYRHDKVVDQIQIALARPIVVKDSTFTLDAFIGICDYPINARSSAKLLECVQSAISYAKNQEHGVPEGVVVYNDELLKLRHRDGRILQLLRRSIQEGTLEVWYQPICHLKSGLFTSAEALVRLPDGEGGYISAGHVIDVAEKEGIVGQVGAYVMDKACTFMRDHGDNLGLKKMGVNLSVQQLLVEDSASILLNQIRKHGIAPQCITLEITETVLIRSIDKAEGILKTLSEQGIGIALDDFGIGYSSLNYLLNLPVSALKIDHSMTKKITKSPKEYALLKAIIDMAEINHISVVVEGVETEEEKEMIRTISATYIQGFCYSRPLSGDKLEEFLKIRNQKAEESSANGHSIPLNSI